MPNDPAVTSAAEPEIVAWLLTAMEEIGKEKNIDLSLVPSQYTLWLAGRNGGVH